MNRGNRRRFESAFPKLLKRSTGRCGLCGGQLKRNSQMFGGFSRNNEVVLTSDCCRPLLVTVHATGIWTPESRTLIQTPMASERRAPPLEPWVPADEPVGPNQDELAAPSMRPGATPLQCAPGAQNALWKNDDTAWFTDNPSRCHRLRPGHDQELAAFPAALKNLPVPEQHRWEMLVRQVGKGRCIRLAFCRDTGVSIPDVEEVIREMFDASSRPGASGVIQPEEVVEIVSRYCLAEGVEVA